jgi:hypothetical protein
MTTDGGQGGRQGEKSAGPKRGLRKHLRRLERQLASAAQLEAKRVRKLEKARWRRQRLEAFIDEVKQTAELAASDSPTAGSAAPAGKRGTAKPGPTAGSADPAGKRGTAKPAPAAGQAAPAAKPPTRSRPAPPAG